VEKTYLDGSLKNYSKLVTAIRKVTRVDENVKQI